MSALHGILNLNDNERTYIGTVGQEVVFEAVNTLMAQWNTELQKMTTCFISGQTDSFKMRYLLPGSVELQKMGRQGAAGAVKRYGYYDVALPLEQWGAELAGSRVDIAYMTVSELSAHLDTIFAGDLALMRRRILTAIFEDTNRTFTDPLHGSLTIRRLANTDSTTYPPVVGTVTEADDDHYSESAYAISAITAANNPIVTLRDEIVEHFGGRGSTGRNLVVFHAADATAYLEAIAGYVDIPDRFVQVGDDTATPYGMPNVPGRVHGRLSGAWLSEWDGWIPDTYMIGLLLEVPAPLTMRVDPADTGLGTGLQLVATDVNHPMQRASYEHRFGLGVTNRLAAAVIEISGGDGTYSPPSAYSE